LGAISQVKERGRSPDQTAPGLPSTHVAFDAGGNRRKGGNYSLAAYSRSPDLPPRAGRGCVANFNHSPTVLFPVQLRSACQTSPEGACSWPWLCWTGTAPFAAPRISASVPKTQLQLHSISAKNARGALKLTRCLRCGQIKFMGCAAAIFLYIRLQLVFCCTIGRIHGVG
jgi:hypothetical protein